MKLYGPKAYIDNTNYGCVNIGPYCNQKDEAVAREVDVAKHKQTITYYKWNEFKRDWVPTYKRDIITEDAPHKTDWREYEPVKMDRQVWANKDTTGWPYTNPMFTSGTGEYDASK